MLVIKATSGYSLGISSWLFQAFVYSYPSKLSSHKVRSYIYVCYQLGGAGYDWSESFNGSACGVSAMLILCMWVTLDEVNRQNLSPARHAANEYGDWVKIVTRIRLSHKPRGLSSIERVAVQ